MECQMGILLENLRDIDWERHWDQNLEVIEVSLMGYQRVIVSVLMAHLRVPDWVKTRSRSCDC